jgi:hypothetical protein
MINMYFRSYTNQNNKLVMIACALLGPIQLLLLVFIPALFIAFVGRYIAIQKGRSTAEGFLFGLFFSLIGLLIIALLPNKKN